MAVDNQLSKRVQSIKISPTLAITAKAAQLKASGKNIITLAAGEPDFPTPEYICSAAKNAIDAGFTKYTPVPGIIELRQAIATSLLQEQGLTYNPASQIVVTCGAKQAIYNLLQAIINPGDQVIIPAPYWVSYPDMILLADGVPVFIASDLQTGFKLDVAKLSAAINAQTKLLILNSPSNPTGAVYTANELRAIAEVLALHPQVLIMTDDIYEHIVWEKASFCSILQVAPELTARTIVINGVSKSYAMTGWRIGYAAGPAKIIEAMVNIQSQSTSNASSISQKAALAALTGPQDFREAMLLAFKQRHDYVVNRINNIPKMQCMPVGGAFYCFFRVQDLIDCLPNIANDVQLTSLLLEQAEVAFVPGSAFGLEGYLRLSFATSMQQLTEAFDRVENLVVKLIT
jgi:aspartate aminotransferase